MPAAGGGCALKLISTHPDRVRSAAICAALRVPEEKLRDNRVPSICLIGNRDGLYYLAEALHERMAGMEYVRIAGADHFTTPFYGMFQDRLLDFFKRHRTAAVSP